LFYVSVFFKCENPAKMVILNSTMAVNLDTPHVKPALLTLPETLVKTSCSMTLSLLYVSTEQMENTSTQPKEFEEPEMESESKAEVISHLVSHEQQE